MARHDIKDKKENKIKNRINYVDRRPRRIIFTILYIKDAFKRLITTYHVRSSVTTFYIILFIFYKHIYLIYSSKNIKLLTTMRTLLYTNYTYYIEENENEKKNNANIFSTMFFKY